MLLPSTRLTPSLSRFPFLTVATSESRTGPDGPRIDMADRASTVPARPDRTTASSSVRDRRKPSGARRSSPRSPSATEA